MVTHLSAEDQPAHSAGCPVHHGRKTIGEQSHPSAEIYQDAQGVWHITGYAQARAILRSDVTKQAGFMAEDVQMAGFLTALPMLYLEGDAHRELRRQTAPFFTPVATSSQYRDLMGDYADEVIAKLQVTRQMDLGELSLQMAVKVAAQIAGLTDSRLPGMAGRLDRLVHLDVDLKNQSIRQWIRTITSQVHTMAFYWMDVKPAIEARKKSRKQDVISHLIDQDYADRDILTECILFGAAGMVTTREFICAAFWHISERPELRQTMLEANEDERYALLHELLRLEPVVGSLYRRTLKAITLETSDGAVTIPADSLIDLSVYDANADESIVGENPLDVYPGRKMAEMRPRVPAFMLSFGDGNHRCPGAYVAIQETDIFLRKLLALDGLRVVKTPRVIRNAVVKGYEIRDFIIAID
jgi:cytochrome P450